MCLIILWADVNNNLGVGGFTSLGNVSVLDEMHGVGAFDVISGLALGKSSKFVSVSIDPDIGIGSVDELAIGLCDTCGEIKDSVHKVGWKTSKVVGNAVLVSCVMVVLDGWGSIGSEHGCNLL